VGTKNRRGEKSSNQIGATGFEPEACTVKQGHFEAGGAESGASGTGLASWLDACPVKLAAADRQAIVKIVEAAGGQG
jgi:hypothetical protein